MNMETTDQPKTSFVDVETTTYNKGHPFDPRNKLVSFVVDDGTLSFKYHTDPDFSSPINPPRNDKARVVGFNIKFDLHWLGNRVNDDVEIWDCQLAEFVYSGQEDRLLSLEEVLKRYGLPPKKRHLVEEYWAAGIQTDEIPIESLKEYNISDVEPLKAIYSFQMELLNDKQKRLVLTMGEDMRVLMEMERNGIKFNKAGAENRIFGLRDEVAAIESELRGFLPQIEHGAFNWDSGDQLSALLYGGKITFDYSVQSEEVYKSGPRKGESYTKNKWFEEMVVFPQRFKPLPKTEVKKTLDNGPEEAHFYQVDEPTLKQLTSRSKENKRLLEILMQRSSKIKLVEMLQGLLDQFDKKQWDDGCIHPQYNQNIVITGRLSSSAPNMQNQPIEVDEFLVSRYDS